jgi:hypothetical protein
MNNRTKSKTINNYKAIIINKVLKTINFQELLESNNSSKNSQDEESVFNIFEQLFIKTYIKATAVFKDKNSNIKDIVSIYESVIRELYKPHRIDDVTLSDSVLDVL